MARVDSWTELEKEIGVVFKDKRMLKIACTHDSYLNEPAGRGLDSNERLEFLGDAVLRLAASKHVYDTTTKSEGVLHDRREEFVTNDALAETANGINLRKYVLLPSGQANQLGSGKVLGDAYEALVGAVFVDQGYEVAANLVNRTLISKNRNTVLDESDRTHKELKKSFYHRFFVLAHDTVDSDKLLKLMGVEIFDDYNEDNAETVKIIDRGAETIGKFAFVAQHLSKYFEYKVKESGKDPLNPHTDFWHIRDQLSEVWIEALHSLLAVRVGLVKQGIYTLRRCFELSIYGTFYSSTFITLDGGREVNPFVELSGRGLWVKNLGKKIGRKDIERIEKQISAEKGVPRSVARLELLSNFTRYYLSQLCKKVCDGHKKEILGDDALLLELGQSLELRCSKCGEAANFVVLDRPLMLATMISIAKVKLNLMDCYGLGISSLYGRLSALLHPNNPGHQHEPTFKKERLQDWLTTLNQILGLSLIFYSRGLRYIGYKDEETFSLLEQRKYDLNKVSLKELYYAICLKVGDEFDKRNLNYKYEDANIPSYLENKGQRGD